MKTTIKAWGCTALIVEPTNVGGGVIFTVRLDGLDVISIPLTPDQTGALIFGLEQATEAAQELEAESFARLYPMGLTA